MIKEKIIAVIIAILVLLVGIISGFMTSKNKNLRFFHMSISIIFISIVILGIPTHFQRLLEKSSFNYITWLHFIMFSFLLYISILAIRKWKNKEHFKSEPFIVSYNNNKYDISNFIKNHPGGSIINNSKDKKLEEVWDLYNVGWHKKNRKVQNILEQYKI